MTFTTHLFERRLWLTGERQHAPMSGTSAIKAGSPRWSMSEGAAPSSETEPTRQVFCVFQLSVSCPTPQWSRGAKSTLLSNHPIWNHRCLASDTFVVDRWRTHLKSILGKVGQKKWKGLTGQHPTDTSDAFIAEIVETPWPTADTEKISRLSTNQGSLEQPVER